MDHHWKVVGMQTRDLRGQDNYCHLDLECYRAPIDERKDPNLQQPGMRRTNVHTLVGEAVVIAIHAHASRSEMQSVHAAA